MLHIVISSENIDLRTIREEDILFEDLQKNVPEKMGGGDMEEKEEEEEEEEEYDDDDWDWDDGVGKLTKGCISNARSNPQVFYK